MSNLNAMRKLVSAAVKNGNSTFVFGTEEAKQVIREAESMHGGDRESTGRIEGLELKVKRLEKRLQIASANKVKDLLDSE